MEHAVEAFFFLAPDLGWLTHRQREILRELCHETISTDDFLDLVVKSRLAPDEAQARDFLTRMAGEESGEVAEPAAPAAPTVPPDLDWFCFLAVADGLVTREMCRGLLTCFEGTTDLISMAQFMITAGFCVDVVRLQRLVDQAAGASLTGQRPYPSVFAAP